MSGECSSPLSCTTAASLCSSSGLPTPRPTSDVSRIHTHPHCSAMDKPRRSPPPSPSLCAQPMQRARGCIGSCTRCSQRWRPAHQSLQNRPRRPATLLPRCCCLPVTPHCPSYAQTLHSQLSTLASTLSSQYQRVASVIDRCQALTASSSTLDDLMRSMNDEERQRRDDIHRLTDDLRLQREAAATREENLLSQLSAERLATWREAEAVKRMESQVADLRDSLHRIEGQYKADRQRHIGKVDAGVQSDISLVDHLRIDAARRRAGVDTLGGGLAAAAGSNSPSSAESSPNGESASHPRMQLRLMLPQAPEEKLSPRSPRTAGPLSARSLSVAAALAAADRGGGGAKKGKAGSPQKEAKEAERPGSRGKAVASRAGTSSSSQSADLPPPQRDGEAVKPWDGIPDI